MKQPAATYRFGPFTLDTGDRRLTSEGHEIYLRPKTYDTLLYLIQRRGHLVSKDELLNSVWSDVEVTENALTRCVKEARAALGDDVQNPRFVRTLPRLGYEFVADVEELDKALNGADGAAVDEHLPTARLANAKASDGEHPHTSVAPSRTSDAPTMPTGLAAGARNRAKAWLRWAAVVAVVTIAAVLATKFTGLGQRVFGRSRQPHIGSLAVLPLENLTGDPQQEYFADGMTEELITNLGRVAGLRVISRTSVMQYKKTTKPLPQIAKELNVDAVIEGAVLRSGNRVRITAQLIQGSTDRHLWAETYDGDLRDIFGLQSEVTGAITREIKAELTSQEQSALAGHVAVNPEAYDLYIRGRMFENSDNKAASNALERAVALDPNFAPAYAALGHVYAVRLSLLDPKDEWKDKAEAAVEKALSLDPNLAEAHVSRAMLLFTPAHGWQYDEAIRESRQALALDPNLAEGHVLLAVLFDHVGLLDEALQELHTAAAINPTEPDAAWFTGTTLLYEGKFQDALPFLNIRAFHAFDLWELGRKQEAWAEIRELLKSDPEETDVWLASVHTLLLADAGKRPEVEKRIQQTLKQAEELKPYNHFHPVANFVAMIYAQLNKPQQAVSWLQETARTGFSCYPFFERDHALDPIRHDPRFVAFMQKVKPQWETLESRHGLSVSGGR